MNAIIRSASAGIGLAAATAMIFADPPTPAMTGQVLVIDGERLIEGDIQRINGKFRIRSGSGEMAVPATSTMILVADREAAFRLVKSHFKTGDPLDRVKLSRWCLANQFGQHAIEEAQAALALLPADRSLKAFCEDVKLRASLAPPPSVAVTKSAPILPGPEPVVVEVNPESFGTFVTKVQPLLMNACADCHMGERGGAFKLTPADASFGDKLATKANLAAASAFLNREQPSASPLLVRAVTVHGDCTRPPLRDRQAMSFRYLEEWARQATGRPLTPTAPAAPPAILPAEAVAAAQPLAPETPKKGSAFAQDAPTPVVLPALGPIVPGTVVQARAEQQLPPMSPPPAKPEPAKAETSDPFDPAIFNRLGQPMKP